MLYELTRGRLPLLRSDDGQLGATLNAVHATNDTRHPSVITILNDSLRQKIDAGVGERAQLTHAQSVGEAARMLHERRATVLLIATTAMRRNDAGLIGRLVAASAAVRTVAVVDDQCHDAGTILWLGACGLREVIDLRECQGWNDLRHLLDQDTDPIAHRIDRLLQAALIEVAPGTKRFFSYLVRSARHTRTLERLAHELNIVPSTLASRFHRARLPSPKCFLSSTRLLFAKALLEDGRASMSFVANRLQYSSPQSFGRHVRLMLGVGASQFRNDFTFNQVANHYLEALVLRHRQEFRTFDPFGGPPNNRTGEPQEGPVYLIH